MNGLDLAIEYFGGLNRGGLRRLAEAIGASQATVSMWRKRGRVPVDTKPWPRLIEQATEGEVPAWRVRPDVYPPPAEAA